MDIGSRYTQTPNLPCFVPCRCATSGRLGSQACGQSLQPWHTRAFPMHLWW